MRKLVIDRTKWLRGEGSQDSCLLRARDGRMCCLGFYSLACGFDEKSITNVLYPVHLGKENLPSEMNWTANSEPRYAGMLGRINDDPDITDEQRELKVIGGFAVHDVQVEFIN